MTTAYEKKKKIARGFDRPSFVLEGFECPDPFATQQTQRTDCVGGSGINTNDDTPQDEPFGDHHGVADQGGDIPMHDPIGSDIPDNTAGDAIGAGLEKPSSLHTSGAANEVHTKNLAVSIIVYYHY